MVDLSAQTVPKAETFRIRPARVRDFEAIRRNHRVTFDEHAAREPEFTVEGPFIEDYLTEISRPLSWLLGAFRKESSVILVAEVGGVVVGHIAYTRHSNDIGPYAAVVCDISIDPAHRRAGLGRALVDEMERREARAGITGFAATVWPENRASQHLFETLGYTPFDAAGGEDGPHRLFQKSIEFGTLPLTVTLLKSAALTLFVIAALYQLYMSTLG